MGKAGGRALDARCTHWVTTHCAALTTLAGRASGRGESRRMVEYRLVGRARGLVWAKQREEGVNNGPYFRRANAIFLQTPG